jgi:hypothetical protein
LSPDANYFFLIILSFQYLFHINCIFNYSIAGKLLKNFLMLCLNKWNQRNVYLEIAYVYYEFACFMGLFNCI